MIAIYDHPQHYRFYKYVGLRLPSYSPSEETNVHMHELTRLAAEAEAVVQSHRVHILFPTFIQYVNVDVNTYGFLSPLLSFL